MIAGPLARPLAGPLATKLGSSGVGFPYPHNGRVLDLASFNYNHVEVRDKSGEDNWTVLYSGRAAHTDGANDEISLGDPIRSTPTMTLKVLCRASAGETIRVIVGGTPASTTQTLDGLWEEHVFTDVVDTNAITSLGTLDQVTFTEADWADARLYDSGGVLIDQYLLGDHTDPTVNGLDNRPLFGRKGATGSYSGCTAITQEGIDLELTGLGTYGDAQWFNGVDSAISFGSSVTLSGDFAISLDVLVAEFGVSKGLIGGATLDDRLGVNSNGAVFIEINNSFQTFSTIDLSDIGVYHLEINRVGTDVTITRTGNGLPARQQTKTINTDDWVITHLGTDSANQRMRGLVLSFNANGQVIYSGRGDGPWQDTSGNGNDGTPSGTFYTVAELRTTPPQVLGMDFNQYRRMASDTSYAVIAGDTLVGDFTDDDCSLRFIGDFGNSPNLLLSSNSNRIRISFSGVPIINIGGVSVFFNTLTASVGENSMSLARSGADVTVTLNGASETRTVSAADFRIAQVGRSSVSFVGLVFDVTFGAFKCNGYGKDPWNGGTESGTFENVLIPESLTKGLDALGNEIEELRSRTTMNADDSGRWEVGDAASLVDCQSWSCRYYHTLGEAATILDLGTPIIEATAGNVLTSTGITSPTYYVNNVAGTSLSAGWNSICVTTATPTDCGPISGDDPTALESDVKAYNLELTADQVAQLP